MVQMMRLLVPPSWLELLEDDVWSSYVRKRPRLPENIQHGSPWLIVARRFEEMPGARWATKLMPEYVDAYKKVHRLLRSGQWEDVSIVSRRKLFKPPVGFTWNANKFQWCGRCRRPTLFRVCSQHHALPFLKQIPEAEPDYRCYYCGVRHEFNGKHYPR